MIGCATEIHRSSCSCELRVGDQACSMEHEEHAFKRRPLGERILDAIGSALSAVLP